MLINSFLVEMKDQASLTKIKTKSSKLIGRLISEC